MNGWETLVHDLILLFAGAWLLHRGSVHRSPLGQDDVTQAVGNLVQRGRQAQDNHNRPQLPRVGS